ncbi:N-acetyldiaminopimelate deacetylase [Thermoactinomyces sp. DSM 45891]|uniref:N-acetyldiaminopimelate deacetylase n=1 Tax=Thermoactinomyces sp. DSM 45891 TaxID=1761907 RepID=UPI0009139493|nr:N-acetyldiaminopimelate deacetylase [Thermoactinomyces sp. DSM 45891]SFX41376.1 N-acetyldiaminopimelate deacetylase [Thermoactinomyces sp. DSM 45891]
MKPNLTQIRRDLHQIPEPGFEEFQTQKYILSFLDSLPQDRLELQTWRTGVLVRITGKKPRQTIAYRTDMDGLPLTEQTTLPFPSKHQGYMHACGHDLHMTIALGLIHHFVHHPVDDHLLFLFQPAEEGPGGAEPMLQSEEFQRWKPDQIYALHIAPEYPVGTIATRAGILFANTQEIFIHLKGKSGHAAYPHLAHDMVVAACQLVGQLQTVIARNINPLDSAIITIGKLHAGTKENIIAGEALLEGTIRTLSSESMELIKERCQSIIQGIEESFQCKGTLTWGSNYCQVYNHHQLTQEFMNWTRTETTFQLIECKEALTGEDFGYFLEQIPGMMLWLGVDTPYGLHHPQIEPNEDAISVAVELMSRYLTHVTLREK